MARAIAARLAGATLAFGNAHTAAAVPLAGAALVKRVNARAVFALIQVRTALAGGGARPVVTWDLAGTTLPPPHARAARTRLLIWAALVHGDTRAIDARLLCRAPPCPVDADLAALAALRAILRAAGDPGDAAVVAGLLVGAAVVCAHARPLRG
jgi:hypothetical protein